MFTDKGFVVLHRKFNQWEWKADPNMVALFIHLLINANHKPKKWQGQIIERGQLITGRNKLAEETGLSVRSVRTCLERLKSTNEVTIKTTKQYSILTIVNYDKYQNMQEKTTKETTKETTHKRPTNDQQTTTTNNDNNINHKNNNRLSIGEQQIPSLDEVREFVQMYNLKFTAEAFFHHHEGTGWKIGNSPIVNWRAIALKWEQKEPSFNGKKQKSKSAKQGKGELTEAEKEFLKC